MNFTKTLVYWADDRTAYWFTTTEDNVTRRYCANDYATFHDWRLGDRQVPGYHSSPVGATDMGAWFRRWLRERSGPLVKISVRPAKSFDGLREAYNTVVSQETVC